MEQTWHRKCRPYSLMTLTAAPITSAGRFSPRGPRGIVGLALRGRMRARVGEAVGVSMGFQPPPQSNRDTTRSRHRAEASQIEAQAGPGSGIPPAKMSQRVSLSDGEGLLPSLCSDEPRAERTDQRVRQRSTHRVRDFVFARFAERPVFARPNLWCMIFIDRERHGVIEQTEARSWAAKMSPNGNSAAMHAAIEPRRAGAE